ncbi:MAG: LptF/LptG family permease [Verrucomicrobiota bacterium]
MSKFVQSFLSGLRKFADSPRTSPLLLIAGILIAGFAALAFVQNNLDTAWLDHEIIQIGINVAPPFNVPTFSPETFIKHEIPYLLPALGSFYLLGVALCIPGFIASLYRRRNKTWLKPIALMCLALLAAWIPYEIAVTLPVALTSHLGEVPAPVYTILKTILIGLLIASPALLAAYYARAKLMERYVLQNFIVPFLFCFVGILAIWVIYDLSDNGPNFLEAKTPLLQVAWFYIQRLPQVVLLIMPVTLLLAVLYCLGKMSRSNELISMLGAGKSLTSILKPIFVFGAMAALVCLILNYEWAPWAEGNQDSMLEKLSRKGEEKAAAVNQMHQNDTGNRTWFIGLIPFDLVKNKLRNVEVRQRDESGRIVTTIFANSAFWFSQIGHWKFYNGRRIIYNDPQSSSPGTRYLIEDFSSYDVESPWDENPWKLISSSLKAEYLGIPQLTSYLKTNHDFTESKLAPFRTHWHYRWSLPFSCIVVVLFAAPLGVVYSRRGILGGVATSIFIFALLIFTSHFFLALGKGGHLPPIVAAWLTNFVFLGVAIALYWSKARNRELPRLRIVSRLFKRSR